MLSVRQNILASNTYENILTHKLSDIVKANARIRKQKDKDRIKGEQSKWINENRELLQYLLFGGVGLDSCRLARMFGQMEQASAATAGTGMLDGERDASSVSASVYC